MSWEYDFLKDRLKKRKGEQENHKIQIFGLEFILPIFNNSYKL